MKTLFRTLSLVPLPLLHLLGACVGWATFVVSGTYRRRFIAHARQAGYRFRDVRHAVAEAGKLLAEAPRLWFGRPPTVEWEGDELIRAAQATGKGLLFLTPHLGCFEATAQGYAGRFGPITVLYRPARKAWLRELVDTARERPNLAAVPTTISGVKQMLKALQRGEAVGLLPDQVPPNGLGAWVPFFGRDAYTMTLPARLARQSGATVLLAWGERLGWGRGYRIHVRSWTGEVPRDPRRAAACMNAEMEKLVREAPGQYLWAYERYKRPRDGRGFS